VRTKISEKDARGKNERKKKKSLILGKSLHNPKREKRILTDVSKKWKKKKSCAQRLTREKAVKRCWTTHLHQEQSGADVITMAKKSKEVLGVR